MTNDFQLDPRLQKDCCLLGKLQNQFLLLMNNSLVPWFILVPETSKLEIHELTGAEQSQLYMNINRLSGFLVNQYHVDKVNIASIGNIVRQMHIHVIGRRQDDYCWPGVVWGRPERVEYSQEQLEKIRLDITNEFADHFTKA